MDKFVYYLYYICFRNWIFCERRGYRKILDFVLKFCFFFYLNLKNCLVFSVVILDLEIIGLSKYFFFKYLKKKKRKKSKVI